MLTMRFRKCEGCLKPVQRRLSCFPIQGKEDDECYAESYIKCFWGLCDQQKNVNNSFNVMPNKNVVTKQPRRKDSTCPQSNSLANY